MSPTCLFVCDIGILQIYKLEMKLRVSKVDQSNIVWQKLRRQKMGNL